MMRIMKKNNPKLESYLRTFFKSNKKLNFIMFMLDIILLGLISFLTFFILFELFGYYSAVRFVSWVFVLFFFGAMLKQSNWKRLFKKFNNLETAAAIEASLNMNGRLVSAVEFADEAESNSGFFNTSGMKQVFIEEVTSGLNVFPKQLYNKNKIRITASLFILMILILTVFPGASKKAVGNFISMRHPQGIFGKLDYPASIFQDSAFTLKVNTDAYRARVNLEHDDESYVKKLETVDDGFVLNLDRVSRRLKFTLYLEKPGRTKKIGPINVDVLRNLFVESMMFNIRYPDYLGRPAEKIKAIPYLELPKGTLINIKGRANTAIKRAELRTKDRVYNTSITGDSFSTGIKPKNSIDFRIFLLNHTGIKNKNPVTYRLKISKDLSPTIRFISPSKNILADRRLIIPLVYDVRDDVGLKSLILEYGIVHQTYTEKGEVKIPFTKDGFGEKRWLWNLNALPISPGEHVNYKLIVTDLAGQKGETPVFRIRLPSILDLLRKSSISHRRIIKDLKTLLKEKRGNLKRIDNLIKNEAKDQRSKIEKEREIKKLLRQHKRHIKTVQKLLNEIKKEKKRLSKRIIFSPKTLKKLREIRRYLKKLQLDMMPKYRKKLLDLLRNKKMSRMGSLRNIKKKMLSELSNLLKALKKLFILRNLEAAKNILKRMKEKSTKIAMRINMKQNYRKAEHEFRDIKNMAKNIQKTLKYLGKNLKGSKNKKDIAGILKNLKDLKNFKALKMSYRKNDYIKSSGSIKAFSQELSQMRKKIRRMINRYQMSDIRKMLDLVRLLIMDFVSLADEIEYTRKKFAEVQSRNSRYSSILKRIVHKSITELSDINKAIILKISLFKDKFSGSMINISKVNTEAKRSRNSIAKILISMQNMMLYRTHTYFKNSIYHMVKLSYNLLFLLDKLKSIKKNAGSGKGELKQGLNSLAEAQRRLDSKLRRLFSRMSKGKLSRAEMEYLKSLSLQQQIIRRALQEYGKGKGAKKTGEFLGDISRILKEMMDIEKQLLNKKLNKKVMQIEKRVLKRLLNASRSLKTRGFKDKYRAEKPDEDYTIIKHRSKTEYIMKIKRQLRRFSMIKGLTDEEQRIIKKYYRILIKSGH